MSARVISRLTFLLALLPPTLRATPPARDPPSTDEILFQKQKVKMQGDETCTIYPNRQKLEVSGKVKALRWNKIEFDADSVEKLKLELREKVKDFNPKMGEPKEVASEMLTRNLKDGTRYLISNALLAPRNDHTLLVLLQYRDNKPQSQLPLFAQTKDFEELIATIDSLCK